MRNVVSWHGRRGHRRKFDARERPRYTGKRLDRTKPPNGALVSPRSKLRTESFPHKPAEKRLFPYVSVYGGYRFGQGNALRAGLDAVLRVGAVLNSPGPHDRGQALAFVHCAGGMQVEKTDLANGGRAHELTVFVYLGANLQAASAGNAVR